MLSFLQERHEQRQEVSEDCPESCGIDLRLVSGEHLAVNFAGVHTVADLRGAVGTVKLVPATCVKLLTHDNLIPSDDMRVELLSGNPVTVCLDYAQLQTCLQDALSKAIVDNLFDEDHDLVLRQKSLIALPQDHMVYNLDLWRLDLFNNHLVSLPGTFGHLTALRTLDLSANKLQALPDTFGQLTALQSLMLQWNVLKVLPDSFGHLAALQSFEVFNNQLTALPETFGQLVSLQTLDISENALTELPASFCLLVDLQLWDMSGNPLKELPESYANLTTFPNMSMSCEATRFFLGPSRKTWLSRLVNRCRCRRGTPVSSGSCGKSGHMD